MLLCSSRPSVPLSFEPLSTMPAGFAQCNRLLLCGKARTEGGHCALLAGNQHLFVHFLQHARPPSAAEVAHKELFFIKGEGRGAESCRMCGLPLASAEQLFKDLWQHALPQVRLDEAVPAGRPHVVIRLEVLHPVKSQKGYFVNI